MNITATVAVRALAALMLLAAGAWWALRQPAVRDLAASRCRATSRTTTPPPCAPTWRRGWPATSSPWTWQRRAQPSRPCPGCARRWCGASSRTGCACICRSTSRWRYWGAESESRLVNSFGEVFEANAGEVERTACRGWPARTARPAQVLAHVPGAGAAVRRRWTWPSRNCALTRPRQLAGRARHRRRDRAGPRHAARRWRRARSAFCATLTQVARASTAARAIDRERRPAARRRLCAAPARREHRGARAAHKPAKKR